MTDRYHKPEPGAERWDIPLNENWHALERDVEHRAPASNRFNVEPEQGKKWLATDTGTVYIGTGTQWRELGTLGSGGTDGSGSSTTISIADDGTVLSHSIDTLNAGANIDAAIGGDGRTATLTATATSDGGGGGTGETVVESDPEVVRAVEYGADPSGISSSAGALQAAIDAAPPGSKVVWGEPGTYYLDAEIEITKRLDVDLRAGTIESDYHDETPWPDDQAHYMPLFRMRGTAVGTTTLTAAASRGTDQITVTDPTMFSVGDGVVVRNATPGYDIATVPGYDYSATPTRVRAIDGSTLYLEDELVDDYASGHYVTQVNYAHRPTLRNVYVEPRRTPTFDETAGRVLGGPRHIVASELCDQPRIESVEAESYDSHVWTGYDDRKARVVDCTAINPMNLSGSCGEPFAVHGSIDVNIIRPTARECRRGIDARSGAGTITVEEPEIVGVTFTGISWHSTTTVRTEIVVNGGRVECRPTDPTMQNTDGSLAQRQELQQGRPFTCSSVGRFESHGTTYVGRLDGLLNGDVHIDGGELYKHSETGSVLTINNTDDVLIDGLQIGASGAVAELVQVETVASNVTLRDITLDCSSGPAYGVDILGGTNIEVHGTATAGATNRVVNIVDGTDLSVDLDMTANGQYAYVINTATDVEISGRISGACSSEVIYLSGGIDVTIDCDIFASQAATVRGIRVFNPEDVLITGTYEGQGTAVRFSGPAISATVRDMRINVLGSASYAIGSDGNGTGISGIKLMSNDLRGTVDTIVMNDAITGLWVTDNTVSTVEYPVGSTVGTVEGNLIY